MYLAIDIGGTKTLAAVLDDDGVIIAEQRFPTPKDYPQFLMSLAENVEILCLDPNVDYHCCVAIPGLLDREAGIVHALGNLEWKELPIRDDICKALGGRSVIIENDARLAGLSEAQLIKQYPKVLFLTVSTGIGCALVENGYIVTTLQDIESGKMPLLHDGKYVNWEDFASGRAIVDIYNQKAFEITDPKIWHEIGLKVAQGLAPLVATLTPDAIVLGGSVGVQAAKFIPTLVDFLDEHLHPVIDRPQAILGAQRPDNAVIYGCYDLAKQKLNS
jgi:predicted NBD/HSP70 family sugar kinase